MSSRAPNTPRLAPPSLEGSAAEGYFAPVTRSAARRSRDPTPVPVIGDDGGSDERRARPRSRSPGRKAKARATNARRRNVERSSTFAVGVASQNGHLAPPKQHADVDSRSVSPLGLIPIHLEFRSFIHRHEIPRKVLHVSIGFLTAYLYTQGSQASSIHPVLLTALLPIAATDVLRHNFPALNALYIRVLGSLMRETEVHGYNGVIWYLLGAWAVLRFCPKDIGVMSVILLSWCDTAASTFGRAWGRYTPLIRRGKTLAGSLAALAVGLATAVWFWGYLAPAYGGAQGWDGGEHAFAFQGRLGLPAPVREMLGWKEGEGVITGGLALGVMSVWTGFVASASEAIDLLGWDDNFTIPVLSAAGLWAFLKLFGA